MRLMGHPGCAGTKVSRDPPRGRRPSIDEMAQTRQCGFLHGSSCITQIITHGLGAESSWIEICSCLCPRMEQGAASELVASLGGESVDRE